MTPTPNITEDTIESLLASLQQAVEEKKRIKDALSVHRDEMKKVIKMIDVIMAEQSHSRLKTTVKRTLTVFVFAFLIAIIISAVASLFQHKEESIPTPAPIPNIVVPVPDVVVPDVVVPTPPDELTMTTQQAYLTRKAITVVRDDVVYGYIRTADLAIQALSALLPSSVRECVIQELGTPDIEYMRDALDILDGKIIIQE